MSEGGCKFNGLYFDIPAQSTQRINKIQENKMIEKCADKVACWLVRCRVIEESDRELYEYAAISFFMSLAPLVLGLIFGLVMGGVKQSIFIILPFMVIRKFSGGYHAKRAWICLVTSSALVFLCIKLSFLISCSAGLILAAAAATASLCIFSPVENENRRLDEEEKKAVQGHNNKIGVSLFGDRYFVLSLWSADVCSVYFYRNYFDCMLTASLHNKESRGTLAKIAEYVEKCVKG